MFVRGLPGEQELLGTAREQLWQQPVQPVDYLGTGVAQLITTVSEHAAAMWEHPARHLDRVWPDPILRPSL
jgi:hypothetical protein